LNGILNTQTLKEKKAGVDVAVTVSEFTEGEDPCGVMLTSLN